LGLGSTLAYGWSFCILMSDYLGASAQVVPTALRRYLYVNCSASDTAGYLYRLCTSARKHIVHRDVAVSIYNI
jgi:hypothetical protein